MLGIPEQALPCAIALKCTICFTLIHDDLPCMDDDDVRRGLPSNHKKFNEATALLAGDALMALAFEVFLVLSAHVEARRFSKALKCFSPKQPVHLA